MAILAGAVPRKRVCLSAQRRAALEADLCYRAGMIRVECIASAVNDARDPAGIWFGSRRVEVRAVTDRWFGADQRWWKVETADGTYIVRLDQSSDGWELAAVVRE